MAEVTAAYKENHTQRPALIQKQQWHSLESISAKSYICQLLRRKTIPNRFHLTCFLLLTKRKCIWATNAGVNLWVSIQHIKIYSHLSTGLMPTLAMTENHLLSLVLSSLRVNPKISYHLTGHQRSGIVKELKEKVWKNVLMHAKYHIFCNRSSWIVEYSNRSELTGTI
jgi:hypothetical protein